MAFLMHPEGTTDKRYWKCNILIDKGYTWSYQSECSGTKLTIDHSTGIWGEGCFLWSPCCMSDLCETWTPCDVLWQFWACPVKKNQTNQTKWLLCFGAWKRPIKMQGSWLRSAMKQRHWPVSFVQDCHGVVVWDSLKEISEVIMIMKTESTYQFGAEAECITLHFLYRDILFQQQLVLTYCMHQHKIYPQCRKTYSGCIHLKECFRKFHCIFAIAPHSALFKNQTSMGS